MAKDKTHKHYRPGPRRKGAGRMGDRRKMWLQLNKWELILYMGELDEERQPEDDYEHGESAFLTITYAGTKKATIHLTAFTEEELNAFEKFVTTVIDKARPICQLRDEVARKAYEDDNDDSFIRLYRPVPRIVVREGAFGEHDEGVSE